MECVEYARNQTVCTSLEACSTFKCAAFECESVPAIHFRNIIVIVRKRLLRRRRRMEKLNPLLTDPLRTSIFEQNEPGAFCGKRNRLLRGVRMEVMASEGILQQLLRKAFYAQQRFLYARDDCLNKCEVLGMDLGCEMVPEDDIEVLKTAHFKKLRHMIFYQCGEFPMLIFIMVTVLAILAIILVFECVIGLVRINRAKKQIAAAAGSVEDEATTEVTTGTADTEVLGTES